jgi:hypothetical protein
MILGAGLSDLLSRLSLHDAMTGQQRPLALVFIPDRILVTELTSAWDTNETMLPP